MNTTIHLRDAAQICAFLYAGALQHPTHSKDYGAWNGHTGFVYFAAECAELISEYLNQPERVNEIHPGVLYYEIIEPLGEWLIDQDSSLTGSNQVLERFIQIFHDWIRAPGH